MFNADKIKSFQKAWAHIVAKAWADSAFKERLLKHPNDVLRENAIDLGHTSYKVYENTPQHLHMALLRNHSKEMQEKELQAFFSTVSSSVHVDDRFAKAWMKITEKAWADAAFKKQLLQNPSAALQQFGCAVPPGVTLKIHENTEQTTHLVIPAKPRELLSEEEMGRVSAGYSCGNITTGATSMG